MCVTFASFLFLTDELLIKIWLKIEIASKTVSEFQIKGTFRLVSSSTPLLEYGD